MRGIHTYLLEDPLAALFLVRRYGVRVMMEYDSRALGSGALAQATEADLLDLIGRRSMGQRVKRLMMHPDSVRELRESVDERALSALKALGILPQVRVEL